MGYSPWGHKGSCATECAGAASLRYSFLPHHVACGILVHGPGTKLEPPTLAMWRLSQRPTRKPVTRTPFRGVRPYHHKHGRCSRASPATRSGLAPRVNTDAAEQQETLSATKKTGLTLKSLWKAKTPREPQTMLWGWLAPVGEETKGTSRQFLTFCFYSKDMLLLLSHFSHVWLRATP